MGCCGNKKNKTDKLVGFGDACYYADDVTRLQRLGNKKNINSRDQVFENAGVHLIAQNGTPECVDALVKLEADFTARNRNRETCLHACVAFNNRKLMPALLKTKALEVIDVCESVYGDTALMSAVKNGNQPMAEMLLRAGASLQVTYNDEEKDTLRIAEEWLEFQKLRDYWSEIEKPSEVTLTNRSNPGRLHVRDAGVPIMMRPDYVLTHQFIKDWSEGKVEKELPDQKPLVQGGLSHSVSKKPSSTTTSLKSDELKLTSRCGSGKSRSASADLGDLPNPSDSPRASGAIVNSD